MVLALLTVLATQAVGDAIETRVPEGIHRQHAGPATVCGISAATVQQLRDAVFESVTLRQVTGTAETYVFADEAAKRLWSIATPANPAYPSIVCRQVVDEGQGIVIHMEISCDATRAACDKLYRDYEALNEQIKARQRAK